MYIFNIKPTPKSIDWFKDNDYDVKAIGAALSLLYSELEPSIQNRKITLTIQVVEGAEKSTYMFTTNKIWLCDEPEINAKSSKQKTIAVFSHFLHEFRHWMQSRVYKISGTKLSYNEEDVERNTNAYFKNKYEVDARRFSKQYISKFYKYYKAFKH